jgi:uncharacterized peroxidase-related enzyme
MTWIRSISPDQATGATAAAYAKLRERSSRPHVSHIWQALGLDPRGLSGLFGLRADLMDDPAPLSLAQAEAIVLVVSATNGCSYCVANHGPKLARALSNEALARAVARDYREADLAARDRVLLDYAVALTCEPAERKQEDVERLREYGFDDAAILKATEITAYYNAINRIVSGLGVPLEDGVEPWEYGTQR